MKAWSNLIARSQILHQFNSMEQILRPVARMISRPPNHGIPEEPKAEDISNLLSLSPEAIDEPAVDEPARC